MGAMATMGLPYLERMKKMKTCASKILTCVGEDYNEPELEATEFNNTEPRLLKGWEYDIGTKR